MLAKKVFYVYGKHISGKFYYAGLDVHYNGIISELKNEQEGCCMCIHSRMFKIGLDSSSGEMRIIETRLLVTDLSPIF